MLHILLWSSLGNAEASCERSVGEDELKTIIDSLELSFIKRDIESLQNTLEKSSQVIECLDTVISPELAARYHLFSGMSHWIQGQEEQAILAFSAAKTINPDQGIASTLFSEDHQIHTVYREAESLPSSKEKGKQAKNTYFDGRKGITRPQEVPTIYQVTRGNTVVLSSVLIGEQPIPEHSAGTISSKNEALMWSTIAASAVGILAFTGSYLTHRQFSEYETCVAMSNCTDFISRDQIERLYSQNQIFWYTSVISFGASAGLGLRWQLGGKDQ